MAGRIPNERQMLAAKLILDGWSGYRALLRAGFSKWSARKFKHIYNVSAGLREAIRLEGERREHKWHPAPLRKRKYDHRRIALTILTAGDLPKEPTRRFGDATARCPSCRRLVSKNKLFMDYSGTSYICEQCVQNQGGFNVY